MSGQRLSSASAVRVARSDPRTESTLCFWRHVRTGRTRCSPPLPKQRLSRLTSTLQALDARLADASYRTVAEALLGPNCIAAEAWRSGLAMMKGGCRNLHGTRSAD